MRAFTVAEVEAIAVELSPMYQPLPGFAAATGLRPEEWQPLERRDVDRAAGLLNVCRTVSSGEVVEPGKTGRSRRQVPLSKRALGALDALPPRLDTPLLFPAPNGGPLNLDNFRRREWAPAVEASGVRTPARIYDLRSPFASRALAAGVSVFALARIMGTSVRISSAITGRCSTAQEPRSRHGSTRLTPSTSKWPSRIENRTHSPRRRPRFQFAA